MDNTSKHARTSDISRQLCDLMLRCLPEDYAPRLDSSSNVCGVHIQNRKSALYWLYHSKKHVRIYLDCEDTIEYRSNLQRLLPIHVTLQARPIPRKGFALRTPLYFDLQTPEQAQSMGPLLRLLPDFRTSSKYKTKFAINMYWHPPSEAGDVETYSLKEGARTSVLVNKYERNRKNRELCIRAFGAFCTVCGFDFSKTYGEIGTGYIHVHHLTPLAALGGKVQKVNPVRDLRPVCPNCHEMLHQCDPP